MEIGVEMTPEQYTAEMEALVAVGADEQIVALARQYGNTIHPQLTVDEIDRLFGVIESAVMALDLKATVVKTPVSSVTGA